MESMDKITFNLKVDEEIQLRNIHPDDAEALFDLMERNRARLRPWIHPSSLPETAKAARLFIPKTGTNCGFKKRETEDLVTSGHDQTI
jgi:hypothetical protein